MSESKETASVKRLRTNVINILRYGLDHDCWDERNYLRLGSTGSRPKIKTKSEVKRLIESGRLKMKCTRTFLDKRHIKGCGKKSFKEISEWCGAHIGDIEMSNIKVCNRCDDGPYISVTLKDIVTVLHERPTDVGTVNKMSFDLSPKEAAFLGNMLIKASKI